MNNTNILEIVKALVIKEKEQNPAKDFYKLWLLKNNEAIYSENFIKSLNDFFEGEIKKGYSLEDLKIEVSGSYTYTVLEIKNIISNNYFKSSQFISYPDRKYFTKKQLLEAEAPLLALIEDNRSKYLNNKNAALEFLESDKFLQNNLSAMNFDKETHDYVLSVKKEAEIEEKAEKEAGKEELKKWYVHYDGVLSYGEFAYGVDSVYDDDAIFDTEAEMLDYIKINYPEWTELYAIQ